METALDGSSSETIGGRVGEHFDQILFDMDDQVEASINVTTTIDGILKGLHQTDGSSFRMMIDEDEEGGSGDESLEDVVEN